jgi:hypothetical protein
MRFNPRLKFKLGSLMRNIADIKPCHVGYTSRPFSCNCITAGWGAIKIQLAEGCGLLLVR